MRQNEISNDNVLGMQMIKNGMIVREKMNLMKWKRNRESMNLRLHEEILFKKKPMSSIGVQLDGWLWCGVV